MNKTIEGGTGKIMRLCQDFVSCKKGDEFELYAEENGTMVRKCAIFKSKKTGEKITVPYITCYKFFSDFDPQPNDELLNDWIKDGGCESPLGLWIETDGYDKYGCPSWLLILGKVSHPNSTGD